VTVSVAGAFHAFHLASELQKRGALARLVSTYPPRYINKRFKLDLDLSRVRSNYLQLATQAVGKVSRGRDLTLPIRMLHDRFAERSIHPSSQIVVGWANSSLRTIRAANREGRVSIVVRGSAHIEEQMAILTREYARCGRAFRVDRRVIEIELAEYAEASFIQTNSTFAKRTLIARGIPEHKVIMVTTGVDLSRFRKVPKEDDVFRFVYCGARTIQKGIHFAVQAFAELDLPKSELYVIGGPHEETEELLRPYASHPRIRFVGHVQQGELYKHFSQGNVFVMPSVQEGLATVQAQAMASGLPLLCTTNTGGEDFMSGEGIEGIVVPPADVAALKEKMQWFYDHREQTAEMGERARARVATGFTWDHYGEKIYERYAEIVRARAA
jgi:glycosyltransferase involved in cell wall biosynthesis